MPKPKLHYRRAALVIDAMSALAIIASTATLVALSVSQIAQQRQHHRKVILAEQVVVNEMEQFRSQTIDEFRELERSSQREIPPWVRHRFPNASLRYTIEPERDGLWPVTVTLRWNRPAGRATYKFQQTYWKPTSP